MLMFQLVRVSAQGSSSRSSSRSDSLTRHPSQPADASNSFRANYQAKVESQIQQKLQSEELEVAWSGERPRHENLSCQVMVPISASELYNGVEKKVFVFPRPGEKTKAAAADAFPGGQAYDMSWLQRRPRQAAGCREN